MLVLKYEKIGAMRFISHIDILRHFVRIMRRANVEVEFSNGFNPHMLIYFSPPLALGISSVAEYVAISAKNILPNEFMARFNSASPKDLKASAVFEVEKDPKLQGIVTCADYILPFSNSGINLGDDYSIKYFHKGELVTENVSEKIYGIWEHGDNTLIRLASGNYNLRADRVATQIATDFGKELIVPNIVKVAQYVKSGDDIVDVDSYLLEKNKEWDNKR